MTARWGLTYPLQGISLSEHGPILKEAEELGYTDAWSAEVESNDAFTPLAAFAAWAPKTRLGCAIASSGGGGATKIPLAIALRAVGALREHAGTGTRSARRHPGSGHARTGWHARAGGRSRRHAGG